MTATRRILERLALVQAAQRQRRLFEKIKIDPVVQAAAVEAGKKAAQTMEQAHVLADQGRPTLEEQERNKRSDRTFKRGENAAYLAARIKRDAPGLGRPRKDLGGRRE